MSSAVRTVGCTLIGDKANLVYAVVDNAAHLRYIGFIHSYLGELELSQPSDNVRSSPPARTSYHQTKNCPVAFAYHVESALTVNVVDDHNWGSLFGRV